MLWNRSGFNEDPDTVFDLNADPDAKSMHIQAHPDPDQTFEGRKPGLCVNIGQFTCFWIRIQIRIPNTDPHPRQPNEVRMDPDPDPQQ